MDVDIAASNGFWCVGRHVHVIVQVHTKVSYFSSVWISAPPTLVLGSLTNFFADTETIGRN